MQVKVWISRQQLLLPNFVLPDKIGKAIPSARDVNLHRLLSPLIVKFSFTHAYAHATPPRSASPNFYEFSIHSSGAKTKSPPDLHLLINRCISRNSIEWIVGSKKERGWDDD